MSKLIELTEDQVHELLIHLNSAVEFEIDDAQKGFLIRIITKLNNAL